MGGGVELMSWILLSMGGAVELRPWILLSMGGAVELRPWILLFMGGAVEPILDQIPRTRLKKLHVHDCCSRKMKFHGSGDAILKQIRRTRLKKVKFCDSVRKRKETRCNFEANTPYTCQQNCPERRCPSPDRKRVAQRRRFANSERKSGLHVVGEFATQKHKKINFSAILCFSFTKRYLFCFKHKLRTQPGWQM